MWSTQRKNRTRNLNNKGYKLASVDIAEIILIVVVFAVGVGGFLYVATKDD